jgi:predicted nucleic acid-binding Zn ribbon protein
MCGKAIPYGETVCSEDCRQRLSSSVKKQRIIWYFFLGLIVAFTVVIVLTSK